MRFFYAASPLVAAATYMRAQTGARIINGSIVKDPVAKDSFFALPTMGFDSDRWLGCGASIISPTFALSSAHCFGGGAEPCVGPKEIALWLGDVELGDDSVIQARQGRSYRITAEVQCSAQFDGKCSHGHDIALLKLKGTLPSWVKPVTLNLGGCKVGDTVSPMGFGMSESEGDRETIGGASHFLRQVSVSVLEQDSERCARVYGGGYGCSDDASEAPATNLGMQFCAGANDAPDRDACGGDSGSPVLDAAGAQVGLVSYGGGPGSKMSGPGRECGDPDYPGVYARVSAFADYIKERVPDITTSDGVDNSFEQLSHSGASQIFLQTTGQLAKGKRRGLRHA